MAVTKMEGLSIYFAGAIRGGRQDADWYGRFVVFLSQFGTVLTEHVGNAALLSEEQALSETDIFERDMAWLKQADLVIAEVTAPSLGVGYELGVAEALGKRVLCLFRGGEGFRLSAMVAGNRHFKTREYHDFDGACGLIKRFILV